VKRKYLKEGNERENKEVKFNVGIKLPLLQDQPKTG
jgi:hypothetical protein